MKKLFAFYAATLSVGWGMTVPAFAQDSSQTTTDDASAEQAKARAKAHFKRGIEAYKAGNFKDAIDAFLDAHRQFPSPVLSFNTARAYEKMGDSSGALRFYREYLRQSPNATDKADVETRITALERKLQERGVQQVTVLSNPKGATVILDGRPVGVTPWTGDVFPGGHRLRLRLEGHDDAKKNFELPAHRSLDVSLELSAAKPKVVPAAPSASGSGTSPPPPTTQNPPPGGDKPASSGGITLPTWIAFGVGAAALGGALTFEFLRRGAQDDVKNERTQLDRHDAFDTMESHQTTARVLAIVGGVAVVTGGVLLTLDLSRDSAPSDSARLGVGCGGSSCGAHFGGRW